MRRRALLYPCLALLLASVESGVAQTPDRDTRWRSDLDALYQRITTVHPNPNTRFTRDEIAAEYQKVRESIATLDDRQVVLGMSKLAAMLNDAHSAVDFAQSAAGLRRYQVAARWFTDGLFLTTVPEGKEKLVGSRIVSLNGRPLDEVYEAIRPWISHDTEGWYRYRTQNYLFYHELLVAAGVAEPDSLTLRIEAETPSGERFVDTINLGAAPLVEGPANARPQPPLYKRFPSNYYWFDWIEDSKTLYIQYNRCAQYSLLPLADFAKALVEFAEIHKPRRWVIDVRENSGGDSRWFTQLISALGSAVQSGRVPFPEQGGWGIIGKRTFSSGTLAVVEMKQAGITLVGEATGGRASWFGENTPAVLPYSRLSYSISTKLFNLPAFPGVIEADIPVPFRASDYFNDRDPYLEAALSR